MPRDEPSQDQFVITLADASDRGELESRASDMGSLEPLPGRDDMFLLRLRATPQRGRAAWQQLRAVLGSRFPIDPVILDERGTPRYPTGRIGVRFKRAPERRELEEFAERMSLRLVDVNKYVAAQAVFEPTQQPRYLPDVVDAVASDERVDRAWPEALAAYRRG